VLSKADGCWNGIDPTGLFPAEREELLSPVKSIGVLALPICHRSCKDDEAQSCPRFLEGMNVFEASLASTLTETRRLSGYPAGFVGDSDGVGRFDEHPVVLPFGRLL
jgi:hypothetical protein